MVIGFGTYNSADNQDADDLERLLEKIAARDLRSLH